MPKNNDFLLSVICPLPDESPAVLNYLDSLLIFLKDNYVQYEVILLNVINDLNPKTTDFVKKNEGTRLLSLLQKKDVDLLISAGLENAIGDVILICIPPCDPIEKIPELIKIAISGKIALGLRPPRPESWFVIIAKNFFVVLYKKVFGLQLQRNTTYFIAIPLNILSYFQRTKSRFKFLKVLTAQVGLPIELVPYQPQETESKYYRNILESFRLNLLIISSQSHLPLRIGTGLSLSMACASVIYAFYVINIALFKTEVAPGWSSISLFLCMIAFVLGIVLATLCEYLSQCLSETQSRPLYTIGNEVVSDHIISNSSTVNVLNEEEI